MKRRQFINWVGVGFLASSLPVAIAACQSSEPIAETPEPIDSTPREDGFAAIGRVAELDEAGVVTGQSPSADPVAIVRDPADATAIVAVNSTCTHQGCTVEWDSEAGAFACPCHGSKFKPDGSVVVGPAEDPLGTFAAKIEGDLVLVIGNW